MGDLWGVERKCFHIPLGKQAQLVLGACFGILAMKPIQIYSHEPCCLYASTPNPSLLYSQHLGAG